MGIDLSWNVALGHHSQSRDERSNRWASTFWRQQHTPIATGANWLVYFDKVQQKRLVRQINMFNEIDCPTVEKRTRKHQSIKSWNMQSYLATIKWSVDAAACSCDAKITQIGAGGRQCSVSVSVTCWRQTARCSELTQARWECLIKRGLVFVSWWFPTDFRRICSSQVFKFWNYFMSSF